MLTNTQPYKILVVDDEEDIRQIVCYNLLKTGYQVEEAENAQQVIEMQPEGYDLLILDIMMDGMDGVTLAKRLKSHPQTKDIPIIFLTAKTSEQDTVDGLKLGADDYIAKPFSIKELLARVEAVLRRYNKKEDDKETLLQYKDLVLNPNNKSVKINNKDILFTKTEFDILYLLLKHKETIFSREDILKRIWPKDICVIDRTVDVRIASIRKKLGPYSKHIATKAGIGYWFKTTDN